MIKFLLILIFAVFLYSGEVQRAEGSNEFEPVDYYGTPVNKPDGLGLDAKKDIPEIFEQKYTISETVDTDSTLQEINGFRVQIFMSEDISEAKRRESMYIESFGEENVLLIFESPFYKIRIGRFRDRDEAEDFREKLLRRGFYRTIIVPDKVKVLMPVKKK